MNCVLCEPSLSNNNSEILRLLYCVSCLLSTEALDEVEVLLANPENSQKLEQAKTMGGQDPMMMMMMVMPIAVQILTPVLQKYGFPVDQAGIISEIMICVDIAMASKMLVHSWYIMNCSFLNTKLATSHNRYIFCVCIG